MPGPWKISIIVAVSIDTLRLQHMYVEAFNWVLPKSGWLSAVYLQIWLTGSEITHTYWISFTGKKATATLNINLNTKSDFYRLLTNILNFIRRHVNQVSFFFYHNSHYTDVQNKKYYNRQVLFYISSAWVKEEK